MDKFSYLSNAHNASIDELYQQYLKDSNSVENGWQKFFEGFEFARTAFKEKPGAAVGSDMSGDMPENVKKEFAVINLINIYRGSGHLFTKTNPVRERRVYSPNLDEIDQIGLSQNDMETVFHAGTELGIGPAKLKDIITVLKQTYCQTIGVEFRYIRNPRMLNWLQSRMESCRNTPVFTIEEKKAILNKLNQAVIFENFLATKFVGQKRFSLEGAETLIPALDAIVEKGAEIGIKEYVIGMAHRGRLNVLANILGKKYSDIFTEFEGRDYEDSLFDGDVKYHQGYSSDIVSQKTGNKIHLSLTPNPSHLEAVYPVVEGIVRAKIDNVYKGDNSNIAPIIIHGDAAIAAQGIIYETVQMSLLDGYKTGGTIHVIINNQIGFTTNFRDARSSTYCTDIAKVVLSPVFHVNGDDVESLVYTIGLAMEFRQKFKRDVFIDLLCYRKHGHNEGDEPRYTQPILYKAIAKHPNPREIYVQKLLAQGAIQESEAKVLESDFKKMLQERLEEAKQTEKGKITSFLEGVWTGINMAGDADFEKPVSTAVDKTTLLKIANKIVEPPKDKKLFNKIEKIFKDRKQMLEGEGNLDWGMAELLAYGTLLNEGHPVRISGQDVERGTFSHRHAVIKIEDSEEEYIPLSNINDKQAPFYIYNSLLSEYGVLGFDYGYAFASPKTLTIWEAQFGDFNNGAQIIIDQYLSSAEDKWRRMNGIVLLLPHGYEHQGAEHSSARMERFLTLCAENNMQVVNCTTPANFFHALRRQLHRSFRKPLIVFSPKSLLRLPACVSKIEEFTKGQFVETIDDAAANPKDVTKLVFSFGRVYYDLHEKRTAENNTDTALIRIEQIYPFPKKQLEDIIKKYKNVKEYLWVQEEPENMGAWPFVHRTFKDVDLKVIARPENATPATGSPKRSVQQQKDILEKVFQKAQVKSKAKV